MASVQCILLISCMLIFTYHVGTGEGFEDNFYGVRRVNITNDLCKGTKLTIECASGQDDLGEHVLGFQSWFSWKFKLNIWRTTLFYCKLRWGNHRERIDVWDTLRDEAKCQRKCWWSIQKDGAYMFDQRSDSYDLIYKWTS